jgi:outer membrane protein OmpA-like peptidoglycan-associated protein
VDLPLGTEALFTHEHELRSPTHELRSGHLPLSGPPHGMVPHATGFTATAQSLSPGTRPLEERWHRLRGHLITVLFAFASSTLSDEARGQLLDEARRRDASIVLDVSGHADRIGRETYNRALSARRADVVADILVAQGIRVREWAYGETCPRALDRTESGHDLPAARDLNRRVVISFASPRGPGRDQHCLRTSHPVATRIY